jgi:hypothetical protein
MANRILIERVMFGQKLERDKVPVERYQVQERSHVKVVSQECDQTIRR